MLRGMLRSRGLAVLTIAYTVVVFATLPVAPIAWYYLLPYLQPHVTAWIACAGAVVLLATAAMAARATRWRGVATIAVVAVAYLALLVYFYQGPAPAKKVHLLEYGLLMFLALEAVDSGRARGVVAALVYVLTVGVLDEVIQGQLPTRTFGVSDIVGNWLGAALGYLAWLAASMRSPWCRIGAHS